MALWGGDRSEIHHRLFGGVEFSKRDLKVPFIDLSDLDNPILREEDMDEYLGRAYLFWTPHRWLALRVEYLFERLKSDGLTDQPLRAEYASGASRDRLFPPVGIECLPDGQRTSIKKASFCGTRGVCPTAMTSGSSMWQSITVCRSGMVSLQLERRICLTKSSCFLTETLLSQHPTRQGVFW